MVVVMDRSLSMGRKGIFNRAKVHGLKVLDITQNEDDVALLWNPVKDNRKISFKQDVNQLKQDIMNKSVSWGSGSLYKSIEEAIIKLETSDYPNREIILISDLQMSEFQNGIYDSTARLPTWQGPLLVVPVLE